MSITKQNVLDATSPPRALSSQIRSQAEDAKNVFQNLELLLRMPYGKDLVASWNGEKTEKTTFFDVVTRLKSEYSQMVAMEYATVESLYSLSILQEYRAKNVADGKLSVEHFVQTTLRSVAVALKSAKMTRDRFADSADNFAAVLETIERNIAEIETKMAGIDKDIATANKQLRQATISLVADIIALAFASATILVAFGFLGPGALAIEAQMGAVAATCAAGIMTVIDSFSIADLVALISSLESAQNALRESLDKYEAIKPRFASLVDGVVEIEGFISGMADKLEQISNDAGTANQLAFTEDDVESIGKSWNAVKLETQAWMDVINAQGIAPGNGV